DELRLDEVRVRMVDELRPRLVVARVDPAGVELRAQLVAVARPGVLLLERSDEPDASPRRCELDLVAPEGDLRAADRFLGRTRHERFGSLHGVAVVRIRLVPLELRELRGVLVGDALVAEV